MKMRALVRSWEGGGEGGGTPSPSLWLAAVPHDVLGFGKPAEGGREKGKGWDGRKKDLSVGGKRSIGERADFFFFLLLIFVLLCVFVSSRGTVVLLYIY